MIGRLETWLRKTEQHFGDWASTHGVAALRITLGVIFVWFGALKFCPGMCDVEVLAGKTMHALCFGLVPAKICLRILAVVECGLGVGLIAGRWMRVVTLTLILHLVGTFLPMVLFPGDTWKHFPYAPTLVGQYILKNLVLIAAGIVVGANAFAHSRRLTLVRMQSRRVVHARPQTHSLQGLN